MRTARVTRKTTETDIMLELSLDNAENTDISTGCGFLDHMLTLFARHGCFGLTLTCKGDTQVDDHHTVEDAGIALGGAFLSALGDGRGITRYGSILLPMDEALILVSLDVSGRMHLSYSVDIRTAKVGSFDTELVQEFLLAFCRGLKMTLHVQKLAGENAHHIIEALFKGLGRALKQAVSIDTAHAGEIPSTKGTLL